MAAEVFVTGGSGFVGSAVVRELLRRGYRVSALINRQRPGADGSSVRLVEGGLFDRRAMAEAARGCAAAIHIVGIIRERPGAQVTFERIHVEGTQRVLEAAGAAGIQRIIHMSALGARSNARSRYHRTKYAAEELVRRSALKWTIFRPSLIHGPGGEFMRMEAAWASYKAAPYIFMPYFGAGLFGFGGGGRLQPVFVDDVARAFVDALEKDQTEGKAYDLGGPDVVSWPELHRICASALVGKRRAVVPIPAWWAKVLTHIVPGALLPFNRDQVIMSQEDNTADMGPFIADLGWAPRRLEPTLRSYASTM